MEFVNLFALTRILEMLPKKRAFFSNSLHETKEVTAEAADKK